MLKPILLSLLFIFSSTVFGQEKYGTLIIHVTDNATSKPIKEAVVEMMVPHAIHHTDSLGNCKIDSLRAGMHAPLIVAHGYLVAIRNVNTIEDETVEMSFKLDRIQTTTLCGYSPTIFFDKNIAEPQKTGSNDTTLNKLIKLLQNNPLYFVEIVGHADIFEDEKTKPVLSFRRSKNIEEVLIKAGIDDKRMACISRGNILPVSASKDKDGKELPEARYNRRVEFIIKD